MIRKLPSSLPPATVSDSGTPPAAEPKKKAETAKAAAGWNAKTGGARKAAGADAVQTARFPTEGEADLNELRQHAKEVGYTFPIVASPWSLFLDNGTKRPSRDPESGKQLPSLSLKATQKAGSPVVPWTVNDPKEMRRLMDLGVDGLISDSPDLLRKTVEQYATAHPGKHLLTKGGLIDDTKFSAQAHRGGRDLRPENTLPSMEVGLDNLTNTLETDVGITKDGVPVLSHENFVAAKNARRVDGSPYEEGHETHIKDLTLKELQTGFVLDKKLPERPRQQNDLALSPVAVAFAKSRGMEAPYQMPTVDQLFDFTSFYVDYYKNGAGKTHPDAERRWKNAEKVHFNIETKVLPETEAKGETIGAVPMTRILADAIKRNGMAGRADIQSFDKRSIRTVIDEYPDVPAVFLFEK